MDKTVSATTKMPPQNHLVYKNDSELIVSIENRDTMQTLLWKIIVKLCIINKKYTKMHTESNNTHASAHSNTF